MDPYFTHRKMIGGEWGIYPEIKVMMALKQLAFGCAPTAFIDYFQMGKSSGQNCLKKFCKLIAKSSLRDEYLRNYTRADATRVSALHEYEFGVQGCIGCLDCMHVFWRLSGKFTQHIDFPFEIGGVNFTKLWLFVDGIYPELARFVKTISVPINNIERRFVKWQEGKRKSVERAFGVLQRKFQVLVKPVEYWFEEDIKSIVETCIILHNMMVEVRVMRDQREEDEWYQMAPDDWDEEEIVHHVPSPQEKIDAISGQFPTLDDASKRALIREALKQQFDDSQSEWEALRFLLAFSVDVASSLSW